MRIHLGRRDEDFVALDDEPVVEFFGSPVEVPYRLGKACVALAQELQAEVRGKRVLLPRSDRANHDLVETLQRLGAHVTEIVAYKTLRPASGDTRYLDSYLLP